MRRKERPEAYALRCPNSLLNTCLCVTAGLSQSDTCICVTVVHSAEQPFGEEKHFLMFCSLFQTLACLPS